MKKITTIMTSMIMAVVLAVSVSAAGINSYEQSILDLLKTKVDLGSGQTYSIPANYIVQAENYFQQADVTKEQADTINGYINEGINLLKSRSSVITAKGGVFHLKDLTAEDKTTILNLGKKACETVGLKLTYDGKNVVITDANDSSKVYFSNSPIIKVTGEEGNSVHAGAAAAGVAAVVVLAVAGVYAYSRKNKLFA